MGRQNITISLGISQDPKYNQYMDPGNINQPPFLSPPPLGQPVMQGYYAPQSMGAPPGYPQCVAAYPPGHYPPQSGAPVAPVEVITMAEIKFNMQSGFWMGCGGGFFFSCIAIPFLLLIFRAPDIPPNGDPKPNAAARAKQAGIYNGLGVSLLIVSIVWIIATIATGLTVYTYYDYNYNCNYYNGACNYTPRYYYYQGPWYIFIGPAIAWFITAIVMFLCGRAKKAAIIKQFSVKA
jgi:hypothetical protein